MASPTLTISNEKESEFKFDLSIKGTEDNSAPTVRFVIEDVNGYDVTLNCSQTNDDRWLVKFPSLTLKEDSRDYRIEVITEGYYFCPVEGVLNIVHTPKVEGFNPLSKEKGRPEVSSPLTEVITQVENEQDDKDTTKSRRLVEFQSMDAVSKREYIQYCKTSAKIFAKVGPILESIAESDKQAATVSSRGLSNILDGVMKSIQAIQSRIYR